MQIKKKVVSHNHDRILLNLHANLNLTFLTIFVSGATLWHWLGPISGKYRFDSALTIFQNEMRTDGSWELVVLVAIITLLLLPTQRRFCLDATTKTNRNDWIRGACFVFIVGYLIGWPTSMVSCICMILFLLGWSLFNSPKCLLFQSCSAVVGYLLIGYAFTILKAEVFWGRLAWDEQFWALDALLGTPHKLVAGWAQASTFRLWIANTIYLKLFAFMVATIAICAIVGGSALVRRYASSLMVVYAFGAIGYLIFPSWGPFMTDHETFSLSNWNPSVWRVASIQNFIGINSVLISSGKGDLGEIHPYAFVAAMPSLHMAIPVIGLILLLPWPRLLWITVPLCLLSIYSTLATGMHYAVDLIAGTLLAYFSVSIAKWLNRADVASLAITFTKLLAPPLKP